MHPFPDGEREDVSKGEDDVPYRPVPPPISAIFRLVGVEGREESIVFRVTAYSNLLDMRRECSNEVFVS